MDLPPVRQPAEDSSTEAIRALLNGHAEFIMHKFDVGRADDINPDYIREIVSDLKTLAGSLPTAERESLGRIRRAEYTCYSAISVYREPQNRPYYFEQLESIAGQIRHV